MPAHANGIQVSRDRWLLVYATRGFRGVDDDLSIVYQLRSDGFDGLVIKEGILARSINDWDPFEDGGHYVRQHGHPSAFGVPKGALMGGAAAANANVFAVMWRRVARVLDPEGGYLLVPRKHRDLTARTQAVEWMQFRLNDAQDDIEILQPAKELRQKGFETGEQFCAADVQCMNASYVQAVPFDKGCAEWVQVHHFDGMLVAACKFRFDAERGLYDWVETGRAIGPGLFEGSIARFRGGWVIAARPRAGESGPAWVRCADPFAEQFEVANGAEPAQQARTPMSVYTGPDGTLRLLTGDVNASPYGLNRNPLYLWDVDPDRGFKLSNRRPVFDALEAGVLRPESRPMVDMGKMLPHAGGAAQVLAHRVQCEGWLANDPDSRVSRKLTPQQMDATGIHYAKVNYAEDYPSPWSFG